MNRKTNIFWMLCAIVASSNTLANPSVWEQSQQLEAKGDYLSAASLLEPLLKQGTEKEFAYLRYGWLHYLQGRYDTAVIAYLKALKLNPQSIDARLGLSLPLLAQGRWQEASANLKQITAVSPWDYTAHVRLLVAEEGLHKWADLARHAELLNRRYPSDTTILVYLARAQAWLGHKSEAKQAYQQVLMRIPQHVEAAAYLQSLQ